jgi:hypothetical protein
VRATDAAGNRDAAAASNETTTIGGAAAERRPTAPEGGRWAVCAYEVVLVESPMLQVLWSLSEIRPGFRIAAVAVARRLSRGRWIDTEMEGQVAWGVEGSDHVETNALYVVRWRRFPWNRWLPTSFAVGPGLSYASKIPGWERAHHPKTNRLLAYFLWEVEFAPRRRSPLRLVARLHHRSGAFGLFNGVTAGSNAVGLGLKFRF